MRAVSLNLHATLPWALENFRLLFTITIFSLMSFLWHKQRNHSSFEIFSLWYSFMRGDTVNFFVTQKCQVVSQSVKYKTRKFSARFLRWYLVSQFVSQRVSVGRSIKQSAGQTFLNLFTSGQPDWRTFFVRSVGQLAEIQIVTRMYKFVY